MTLPDWTTEISAVINQFLGWSAIAGPMTIIIGAVTVTAVIFLVLKAFHH